MNIIAIAVSTFALYFILWKWPVLTANIETDIMASGIHQRVIDRLYSNDDLQLIFDKFIKYSGIYFGIFLLNFFRTSVKWVYLALPALFATSYFGILFLIYLSTPNDLEWHLATSVKRAVLPINVVLLGTFLYSFVSPLKNSKRED